MTWETTPPARVGSRIAFVAHFLGRRIAYTYEVRELVPAERFVMSTAEGPFPMRTTYTWADTEEGGTRMTLRNDGEPSGFGRLAAPVMAAAMRRANLMDLQAPRRCSRTLREASARHRRAYARLGLPSVSGSPTGG